MRSLLVSCIVLTLLAGCVAPKPASAPVRKRTEAAAPVELMQPAPMARTGESIRPDECGEDGDGIGGTGCPVR